MKCSDIVSYCLPGFGAIVTAVAAWSIWGGDMFPAQPDPVGGELDTFFLVSQAFW